jgi:hypothetical protein
MPGQNKLKMQSLKVDEAGYHCNPDPGSLVPKKSDDCIIEGHPIGRHGSEMQAVGGNATGYHRYQKQECKNRLRGPEEPY